MWQFKLNQSSQQDGGNTFQPMDLGYELAKLTEQTKKRTKGKGILSSVGDTAAELFIRKEFLI